jgi:hypothetical protein
MDITDDDPDDDDENMEKSFIPGTPGRELKYLQHPSRN